MATNIGNTVHAAGEKAQYDQKAKQILRDKNILAHILVKSIDDFQGMNPKDVIPFIEGDPYVSVVPVDESLLNTEAGTTEDGDRIVGMNTEDSAILEGMIRFDVVFYVRLKDGISQVIVNVEAQKDEPSEYDIINRAVFSGEVPEERKLQIMNEEYDIEITRELREEMNIMCNLSKGIAEKAEAKAIKAKNIRIVLSMNSKGFPISDIAEIAEISVEEVKAIIVQNKDVVLV